jgi:dienelactone hydrolase
MVRVTCACKKTWFVDDELAGTQVGCKSCGGSALVPGQALPPGPNAAAPQPYPQSYPQAAPQPSPTYPPPAAPGPTTHRPWAEAPTRFAGEFVVAYQYPPPWFGENKLYRVYREGDALAFIHLGAFFEECDFETLARGGTAVPPVHTAGPRQTEIVAEEAKVRGRLAAVEAMDPYQRTTDAATAPSMLAPAQYLGNVRLLPDAGFEGSWATNSAGESRAWLHFQIGGADQSVSIRSVDDLRRLVGWLWDLVGQERVYIGFPMQPPLAPPTRPPAHVPTYRDAYPAAQKIPTSGIALGGAGIATVIGIAILWPIAFKKVPALAPPAYVAATEFPTMGHPTPTELRMTALPRIIKQPIFGAHFNEVILRRGDRSSKLWIYRPEPRPPGLLPCVLIAPAGTPLVHGIGLSDGDRTEHKPYVRAGMVVVAYELDGPVPEEAKPDDDVTIRGVAEFVAAEGGVKNAQDALNYVLAKIPEVDPNRIYTAGHSSAATVALHVAQHEPRIKAVAAYAPCTDPEDRLGEGMIRDLDQRVEGFRSFVRAGSPFRNAAKLKCPVFLFHAPDDFNVRMSETEAFASEVRKTNPKVTFHRSVTLGGHYDPMIREGIPQGIGWLMNLPEVEKWRPHEISIYASRGSAARDGG